MGINQATLLDGTGLSPASIQNASGQIPAEQLYALWDNTIRLSGNELFGLHAAEKVPLGAYRIPDYLVALSASPRDAMERSNRSFALITDVFRHAVRQHRDLAYLELHSAEGPQDLPRPYIEFILGNYLVRLRMATQTRFRPAEVHLTYREPRSTREYDRFFGAPVRFRQALNRLVFPKHLMEMRQPLADPELCELLESYACQQLRQRLTGKLPLADIREALAVNLLAGRVTLTALARQLAKSTRSLQREFHAHGTTFRELLDRVRLEEAVSLLRERNMPICEIATRLGFSDANSLTRAFQRWTGRSPREHRAKLA
jgi:AraC-like DNA-binding protein